jgi:hypothetical protein
MHEYLYEFQLLPIQSLIRIVLRVEKSLNNNDNSESWEITENDDNSETSEITNSDNNHFIKIIMRVEKSVINNNSETSEITNNDNSESWEITGNDDNSESW